MRREIIKKQVCRTGLQTLEHDPDTDKFYVTLKNRSVQIEHEIPIGAARRWFRMMAADAKNGRARDISVTSD